MSAIETGDLPSARALAQDERFGVRLADHQGRLLSLARRLCWSGTEAEDMVQQTLLKAWTHRAGFAAGTDLSAWLRTILRNEIHSEGRRNMRRPVRSFVEDVDDPVCLPSQEWSLAIRDFREQLARLAPAQADALMTVGALGYDHEEAAQMAGCALGTMKSRVSRARACLRKTAEAGLGGA